MQPGYHQAIVESAVMTLRKRAVSDGSQPLRMECDRDAVFVWLVGKIKGDEYVAKVDLSRYPVEPYEVGFIDPATSPENRLKVSDRDARFWPWSPMPGIHGSFNLQFPRAIRIFWCRECTNSFFYYHGHEAGRVWEASKWPLHRVVDELRVAVTKADHPRHWRWLQRSVIEGEARRRGVELPDGAAIDRM